MTPERGGTRYGVHFDELAFAEDLRHASPAGRDAARAARTRLALVDAVRRALAEPRLEEIIEVSSIPGNRGRGIGLWLAATATLDPAVPHTIDPLVAERPEGRSLFGALAYRRLRLVACTQPCQDLVAVLSDDAPFGLPGRGTPSLAAVRRLAPASPPIERGRAAIAVPDEDPGRLRLAELRRACLRSAGARHDRLGRRASSILRWTHVDTNVRSRAVRSGSLRPVHRLLRGVKVALPSRNPAEAGLRDQCRRRDSNPRHADYDSAALTD
jgi:hypothetical protein